MTVLIDWIVKENTRPERRASMFDSSLPPPAASSVPAPTGAGASLHPVGAITTSSASTDLSRVVARVR
jgi:hypothetical protein